MRVLVALGGNAMTGPDGDASPAGQRAAVERAVDHIAEVVAAGHEVVITHGNGPQVGNALIKSELAATEVPPEPLDWCGAETQATLGYTIVTALERRLTARGSERRVAAIVTRTLVAADDTGFVHLTKPIGRHLPYDLAKPLIEHGQTWEDRGPKGWRRVVASPEPLEVIDAPAVRALLDAGFVVIGAGGGGIPMIRDDDGLRGVEAVVDKDLTAALLGRELDIDVLVIATDVEQVAIGYGTPAEQPLGRVTPDELSAYAEQGQFASGSMGPKVEASLRFVRQGGRRAAITTLDRIAEAVAGRAGTIVEP